MELVKEHFFQHQGCTFVCRDNTSDDGVVRSVFEGEYEMPDCREQPESNSVSADFGAHIGAWTVWIAKKHPTMNVIAIEPLPENVRLIHLNVHLNGLDGRVQVIHGAVGSIKPFMDIGYTGSDTEMGKYHRFVGNMTSPCPRRVVVPTTNLRAVMVLAYESFQTSDLWACKLDCEGGEVGLLENATREELRAVRWFVGEHHGAMERINRVLLGNGFRAAPTAPNQNTGLFVFNNINDHAKSSL